MIRSDFFKELKERQLRYELARLEEKQRALAAKTEGTAVKIGSGLGVTEPTSVTDATTRELQGAPKAPADYQG
ncbi:MAG: hypothetical protein AABN33_24120 [Acidobacteriota bacterium]